MEVAREGLNSRFAADILPPADAMARRTVSMMRPELDPSWFEGVEVVVNSSGASRTGRTSRHVVKPYRELRRYR